MCRWLRSVVSCAVVVAVLSACSGAQGEDAVKTSAPPPVADSSLPASPVADRLVECMTEDGWEVSRSWSGGIDSVSIPQEQLSAYNRSLEACSASSGWSGLAEISQEQKRELYDQEVANHRCLVDLGVESADPPTLETYMATYQTAEQYYSFLPGFDALGQAEMERAVAACPPPTWFMNISGLTP